MHTFDLIIIVIFVLLVITGIKRGLILEIIRLVAIVVGAIFAFIYFQELSKTLFFKFLPMPLKEILSFLILYIITAGVILLLGWLIKKIIHLVMLGWIDRLGGGVIGVIKAIFITYVICLSLSSFPFSNKIYKSSIVFRTYKRLPKSFALSNLLEKREKILKLWKKEAKLEDKLKNIQNKIETFKESVDSAKKAVELKK